MRLAMARGRDAARAAHRREVAAQGETTRLRTQLAEERAAHRTEVESLKAEVVKLRAEARRKAGQIADSAIESSRREVADEREDKNFVEGIANTLARQHDAFVREACRYISMTTGAAPEHALAVVWTWITSEPLPYGLTSAPDLERWGIYEGGWVSLMVRSREAAIRIQRNRARLGRRGLSVVKDGPVTLDQAEKWAGDPNAPEHEKWRDHVHPSYHRWSAWYRAATEEEFTLLDSLAEPDS